jgi:endonuclease YncB( thermonuclease family)
MRRTILLVLALAWLPAWAAAAEDPTAGLVLDAVVRVTQIVDGDTVVLADGRQVRLVGIQAPKLPLGRKGFEPWPLAGEAKAALGRLALGRELRLGFGGRRQDRHGRILAHLYDQDGLWIQGALLERGLARVYSFADNRALVAQMLARERQARGERLGIWGQAFYGIRDAQEVWNHIGSFQLVEGRVREAAKVKGRVYLNYGADWRRDFTVTLAPAVRRRFEAEGIDPLTYGGRRLRVRGWVESYNGPMIEITHPEQIELLEE